MAAVAFDASSQLEELTPIIELTHAQTDNAESADLKTFDDVGSTSMRINLLFIYSFIRFGCLECCYCLILSDLKHRSEAK
jgi:hypothetical protein